MELIGSPEAVDLARLCIEITLQQRKGGDGPTVVYSDLERREDTEFLDVPERENCVGFILGAKGATMRQARTRARVRARARRGRGQGRGCIVQVQVHTPCATTLRHCRPAPRQMEMKHMVFMFFDNENVIQGRDGPTKRCAPPRLPSPLLLCPARYRAPLSPLMPSRPVPR